MRPDHDQDRCGLALRSVTLDIIPEVPPAVQTGADTRRPLHLHPVEARIAYTGIGVLCDHDRIRNVAPGILRKVRHDWENAEIDVLAFVDDLLHRGFIAKNRLNDLIVSAGEFFYEGFFRDSKCCRKIPA